MADYFSELGRKIKDVLAHLEKYGEIPQSSQYPGVTHTLGELYRTLEGSLEALPESEPVLNVPLDHLPIGPRERKAFHDAGCDTVSDVYRLSLSDPHFDKRVKGIGQGSRGVVRDFLRSHGYELGE